MKAGLLPRTAGHWNPRRLGRSLPIYPTLRRWSVALGGLALVTLVLAVVLAWRQQNPRPETPLEPIKAESLVLDRMARVTLPPWDPGPRLPGANLPDLQPPPAPPPWPDPPPGDRLGPAARAELRRGHEILAADSYAAANHYSQAVDKAPEAWSPRFHFGLAQWHHRRRSAAAENFQKAADILYYRSDGATHHAARAVTHFGAGLTFAGEAAEKCDQAIENARNAVRALESYRALVKPVYERELPFRLEPARMDSLDIWLGLVYVYRSCQDSPPESYREAHERTKKFTSEFEQLPTAAVEDSPFAEPMKSCYEIALRGNDPPWRCWAATNLSQLWHVNRARLEDRKAGESMPFAGSLARLVYTVAWLAADLDRDQRAAEFLELALELNRGARDEHLGGAIAALGGYLAPRTQNYAVLAERWLGVAPAELRLDDALAPEELKGVAHHLRRRWQGMQSRRQPAQWIEEVETLSRRAGPHGASLRAWKGEAQVAMQDALLDTLREARDNGNTAEAVALRDFRADYLGGGWPGRVRAEWRRAAPWLLWLGLWALFALLLGWLYRFVVYPYLMYTTDFYRTEFQHRHAAAWKKKLPFTRAEFFEVERARRRR